MKAAPDAERAFTALSYSNKRQHVLAIEGAKAAATRQRRIDKAIAVLSQG
ncbi:YdeI/OmpD-associated family protein [Allokutzneria oryzae]|uniref:YdeI/OmpD-associated family protein n=1 Tax=Allokutzneria oryzae TaxID=1378989 RepID=A0ABV5ZXV6_9PSEU